MAAPASQQRHGHSLPPFTERGSGPPSRDDSLRSLPGGSNKSPPLRRPAQRSGAGALCRATSGSTLGTERRAAQRVRTWSPQERRTPNLPPMVILPEQWPARRAILAAVPVLTPDPKGRGPELSSRPRGHWTRPESPTCGPAGPAPPPGMSRRNHPESRLHVWF